MARKLRRSVVVGGTLVPAGTAETPELAKVVTNPAAWDGKAEAKASSRPIVVEAPAESESRAALEKFAVTHAGMSREQAEGYGNKGELHAAIVAALKS